ncbi:hypothetical protein MOC17_05235 [Bacillus haynesii]|nr:hypothetical protein [Bacillus haynesii]
MRRSVNAPLSGSKKPAAATILLASNKSLSYLTEGECVVTLTYPPLAISNVCPLAQIRLFKSVTAMFAVHIGH